MLGDPWEAISAKHPVGSTVEGPVTNLTQFGGFVDLGDGIEGMVHISDITNEKRLEHPREKLAKGQSVKAIVLEIDRERTAYPAWHEAVGANHCRSLYF